MPQMVGRRQNRCRTCAHAERARIDYLLCSGAPHKPTARKFGLTAASVFYHYRHHVSLEYKAAIKIGPIQNEEHLRLLCVETNTSVLERHRAAHAALTSMWLAAFEAEAHDRFCDLHAHMRKDLEFEAKLTKELLPPSNRVTNVVNNNVAIFQHPEYVRAVEIMRDALAPWPEARKAVAQALRVLAPPPTIEHQPS